MSLSADDEVGGGECLLDGGDELMVGDRTPAFSLAWCLHFADFVLNVFLLLEVPIHPTRESRTQNVLHLAFDIAGD